jgi:hypothetical protein
MADVSATSVGVEVADVSRGRTLTQMKDRRTELIGTILDAAVKPQPAHKRRRIRPWLDAHAEYDLVARRRGEGSWQARLVKLTMRHDVQTFFLWMLIIDVIVVFVELYIDAEYPNCRLIERDAISCCEDDSSGSSSGSGRMLTAATLCAAPTNDAPWAAACDSHKWEAVHKAHTALFVTSVCILSSFAIELVALFIALGLPFCRNPLYLVDAVVVLTTLALEISLRATPAGTLPGMLILARLWRFLRIAHGVVVSTHETEHHAAEHIKETVGELQEELERLHAHARELEAKVGMA